MRRAFALRILAGGLLAVLLGVAAATVIVQTSQPELPIQATYVDCQSSDDREECSEASRIFNKCASGNGTYFGEKNCQRVISIHDSCRKRLPRANDAVCTMAAHDYLQCFGNNHGGRSCYIIEMRFIECLEVGISGLAGCKSQRAVNLDCLYLRNRAKISCKEALERVFRNPQPI